MYIYIYMYVYTYIYIYIYIYISGGPCVCMHAVSFVRPISVLHFIILEGLTQAESKC